VNPVAKYTLLRLGLFVACLAALYAVGGNGWLVLVLAAVISLALSYVLLRRQREEMAEAIADRVQTRHSAPKGGPADDAAYEDAVDEAMRRERGEDAGSPA
jgi:hypothetical protein